MKRQGLQGVRRGKVARTTTPDNGPSGLEVGGFVFLKHERLVKLAAGWGGAVPAR